MTPRPALHLPLNGSLAGTAANVAYTATGNGALRYRDADLGGRQCALVEEAGTNLVLNPSFETGVALWRSDGTSTISQDTSHSWSGDAGALLTRNSHNNTGVTDLTVSAAGTFAMSAYLFIPSGSVLSQALVRLTGFTGSSLISSVNANVSVTDTWQRIHQVWSIDAGDLVGYPIIQTDGSPGDYSYADAIQVEEADHITTYIDGSLGTGYAWSGTPHASSSTRALTTIEADYDSTIEHIFCRYSEDFGATWDTASLTSATTFGSYASFDLTGGKLTIESSRALMVRDVVVYDTELPPVYQEQIIAAIEAGTFGAGRKPLFVPRGYPVVFVNVRK